MQISLRPATQEDCDFLWGLHRATMRPYVEDTWGWDEQRQAQYFRDRFDPTTREIVEGDGVPIGCISVERREHLIFLSAIEIAPDLRTAWLCCDWGNRDSLSYEVGVRKRLSYGRRGGRPHIFRPPAPVEVKKAGRCAFVQTPPSGYNQGE